jgi:methylated-DNA-[protein]-cysteine S-methyltransferase
VSRCRADFGSSAQVRTHYIALMSEIAFALFDTAIGRCVIAWTARGIAGVGFPEASEQATRARMLRRHPAAREASPPGDVQAVIDDIVALLAGSPRDFRHARLDMTGLSDLQRRVYEVAQKIPAGATLTYGEIAERLGDRSLARDVGEALGHNPFPIIVPCHRVLAAGSKIGGFSAPGGIRTKFRLLEIEGAQPGGPTLFADLPLTAPRRRRH